MTSNFFTYLLQDVFHDVEDENSESEFNKAKASVLELLKKSMRPEFLNRIDEIVLFKPLTQSEILEIAKLQISKLIDKMSNIQLNLIVTPAALEWIVKL